MTKKDLDRLMAIEKRVCEIAKASGLLTTEIDFEIVPAQRMLEGMAYMFPSNFSHWSFGRDYEKYRTIYEHTGQGIPYEQVWNFDRPKALLVETNPVALNAMIIAHVYGHVDYFLGSRWLQRARLFSDVAEQARHAAARFREYEVKYGKDEVERTIDAGMSIWWQQHPDVFMEEELDNEVARDQLMAYEHERLKNTNTFGSEFKKLETKEEIKEIDRRLRMLSQTEPPQPIYDLLGYIIRYSPKLKPWQQDVLTVLRNQARALAPNMRTKMLDEGWASYWHVQITRQLFNEGLLTPEEHGTYNAFHSGVTRENKLNFNVYRIGLGIFDYVKEKWDKGRFGREYDECENLSKKAYWDTGAMKGKEKIFSVRTHYSDRMAVEDLFTDEFIHEMKLYIYEEVQDDDGPVYVIAENNPEVIRKLLKSSLTLYGFQAIAIRDSDYGDRKELFLKHDFNNVELDARYLEGTLRNIFYLWGRKVFIQTVVNGKDSLCGYDKKGYKVEK